MLHLTVSLLLSAVAAINPVQVTGSQLTSTSLTVQVQVQNIAYTKQVSIVYCDASKSCGSSFACVYQNSPSSSADNFQCKSSSFTKGLSSFYAKYIVSGSTYYDKGSSGQGYPAVIGAPAATTSPALTSKTTTSVIPSPTAPATNPADCIVILEAFTYQLLSNGHRAAHFDTLNQRAPELIAAGFGGVWLPPHTPSADNQGYLPTYWLRSQNEAALRGIIGQFKSAGVITIADFVVNHRSGVAKDSCTGQYTQFLEPTMGNWAVTNNDLQCGANAPLNCPSNCGCGAADTGENICYAPDLDHSNTQVQSLVAQYIAYLRDNLGFSGMRIDVSTGYLPKYQIQYKNVWKASFAVAEFFDGGIDRLRTQLFEPTNYQLPAFDYPLYYILQRAVLANDYSGVRGSGVLALNSSVAVTFVANHDTYQQGATFGSGDQTAQGYAFILTHPGVPCVFWNDYENGTLRPVVATLMALRKEVGVAKGSKFTVAAAQSGLYAAYVTGGSGRMIAVSLGSGSGSWSPGGSYTKRTSGNGYTVWTL